MKQYDLVASNAIEEFEGGDFVYADEALAEIERLNAQVAMLRHNIAWVSGLVENWSGEENGHHDRIMSQSSDEWLADHDAKVRDDAIEEMAVEIESFRSDYDKYSVAEAVRSMKGKS